MPDAVLIVGADGTIEYANQQVSVLGYQPADLVGQRVEILVPAALRAEHLQHRIRFEGAPVVRAMGGGRDLTALHADGRSVPVSIMLRPLDPEGRTVVVVRDVSRRHYLEDDHRRLATEAEAALVAREEMVAIASHDLRSPLGGVKLQIVNLRRMVARAVDNSMIDAALGGRAGERLGQIDEALGHMFSLLDSLLDRQRRQAGRVTFHREPVDLGALVERVVQRMAVQVVAAGSRLETEVRRGVVGSWDRLRLEQVLTNLLSNALRHAPGAPIMVAIGCDGERAHLRVADRGPGIASEEHQRVFGAFERGDRTTAPGHGLGLWIVRALVEAHGGSVSVESAAGVGTTFLIELPLAPPAGRPT